ncbi:XTP/dITP diphosphatase [Candidatus Albibeggiatoa sp. nov. NOAA]|uniref:XTP/dITP diphosphatase n=1 Tax=Candidatus Albibeggiatoa sp. nov. NOAA TaxID=3162724 RepID=UPI0032F2F642|nr:XTP/dITP diphosphatase [Thiotrichaceae bacterium]
MDKIVIASGNKGKIREFQQIFTDFHIEVVPQTQFDVSNAEETGLTFVENAILKARHAAQQTQLPALADDSGIEVDALQGAPGIYSARFAGEGANDQTNNQLLLEKLRDVPEAERTARFQCIIVFMRHAQDATPLICQGTWEGRILIEPQGENGFGYDPVFFVPTHDCSSAQLPAEIKNQLSHRGQAMQLFKQQVQKYL